MRRPGWLRHTDGSAESCCLPALTRFTGARCAGPGRRTNHRRRPSAWETIASLLCVKLPEECESGRIGTTGNRVTCKGPWVQIPSPPPPGPGDSRVLSYRDAVSVTTPEPLDDTSAMRLALAEAAAAGVHGDVPVGALCIVGGQIVSSRHNEREQRGDPTAHAEILALADASRALGTWRLGEVTLVVTLEPCPMCAGALVAARVGRLVFGAADPKAGACGSLYQLCADPRLNHELPVTGGVLEGESAALLTEFFAARRAARRDVDQDA